jgi:hypothetical protein
MIRAKNPHHQKNFQIEGYEDLGWQNGWKPMFLIDEDNKTTFSGQYEGQDKYNICRIKGHKTREVDNSISLNRGTNNIVICDICKHFSHYDCSD